MTHIRRNRMQGQEVVFTLDMKLTLRKDEFLSNTKNKARFVCALLTHFREHSFTVLQAGGDADVLIVTTAVKLSVDRQTTVVGDNTDLLILLCFHEINRSIRYTSLMSLRSIASIAFGIYFKYRKN